MGKADRQETPQALTFDPEIILKIAVTTNDPRSGQWNRTGGLGGITGSSVTGGRA